MNKWMSKCQDKYIVVQPIGRDGKLKEKRERESIWCVADREACVANIGEEEERILESGTRYEAVS